MFQIIARLQKTANEVEMFLQISPIFIVFSKGDEFVIQIAIKIEYFALFVEKGSGLHDTTSEKKNCLQSLLWS